MGVSTVCGEDQIDPKQPHNYLEADVNDPDNWLDTCGRSPLVEGPRLSGGWRLG
jgi:hypothetical protein